MTTHDLTNRQPGISASLPETRASESTPRTDAAGPFGTLDREADETPLPVQEPRPHFLETLGRFVDESRAETREAVARDRALLPLIFQFVFDYWQAIVVEDEGEKFTLQMLHEEENYAAVGRHLAQIVTDILDGHELPSQLCIVCRDFDCGGCFDGATEIFHIPVKLRDVLKERRK